MSIEVWITYVLTVMVFMSTPGPSHLLMLSNSMRHGFQRSLATAVGDLTANSLQMLAAGLGLAALLIASQGALSVIKWLGVAYLIWLGIRMILTSGSGKAGAPAPRAKLKTLWLQGFLTSAANPKAVVFFAALFPQFIDQSQPFAPQFFILSITYIVIDGTFLTGYGASASWFAKQLKSQGRVWLDRIGGTFLIGAAILLGLKTFRDG